MYNTIVKHWPARTRNPSALPAHLQPPQSSSSKQPPPPPPPPPFERFDWAIAIVDSRGFVFGKELADGDAEYEGLVPLVDLMNHSSARNTTFKLERNTTLPTPQSSTGQQQQQQQQQGLADVGGDNDGDASCRSRSEAPGPTSSEMGKEPTIVVRAARDFSCGDELFGCYGAHGSAHLLHRYGFAIPPELNTEPDTGTSNDVLAVTLQSGSATSETAAAVATAAAAATTVATATAAAATPTMVVAATMRVSLQVGPRRLTYPLLTSMVDHFRHYQPGHRSGDAATNADEDEDEEGRGPQEQEEEEDDEGKRAAMGVGINGDGDDGAAVNDDDDDDYDYGDYCGVDLFGPGDEDTNFENQNEDDDDAMHGGNSSSSVSGLWGVDCSNTSGDDATAAAAAATALTEETLLTREALQLLVNCLDAKLAKYDQGTRNAAATTLLEEGVEVEGAERLSFSSFLVGGLKDTAAGWCRVMEHTLQWRFLSLSLTHTHTHTHTLSRLHTHTLSLSLSFSLSLSAALSLPFNLC